MPEFLSGCVGACLGRGDSAREQSVAGRAEGRDWFEETTSAGQDNAAHRLIVIPASLFGVAAQRRRYDHMPFVHPHALAFLSQPHTRGGRHSDCRARPQGVTAEHWPRRAACLLTILGRQPGIPREREQFRSRYGYRSVACGRLCRLSGVTGSITASRGCCHMGSMVRSTSGQAGRMGRGDTSAAASVTRSGWPGTPKIANSSPSRLASPRPFALKWSSRNTGPLPSPWAESRAVNGAFPLRRSSARAPGAAGCALISNETP